MKVGVLIPAFNPPVGLIAFVRNLAATHLTPIIVVNDGSDENHRQIFRQLINMPGVVLLEHALNSGKGAALKTGLNYFYCNHKDHLGVLTLDADGQHLIPDGLKVAAQLVDYPRNLILGVRAFGREIPWRSKVGNSLTRIIFKMIVGQKISDTQTGMRAIPTGLIPTLLKIESDGYEFELDMLLISKHSGRNIVEENIATVYLDGNKLSHFNPIFDSMKIYYVLLRFSFASLGAALIDSSIFVAAYHANHSILLSQILARAVSLMVNYTAVRKMVFYSEQKHGETLPKYILLVVLSGSVSYFLIGVFVRISPLSVIAAKIITETLIFFANFAIQRDFIFTRSKKNKNTDWDKY
jgi:putative flippase GtrA